jgi:hypothetical protein
VPFLELPKPEYTLKETGVVPVVLLDTVYQGEVYVIALDHWDGLAFLRVVVSRSSPPIVNFK